MKKIILEVLWTLFWCLSPTDGLKYNKVEELYYWREVIYEDLPFKGKVY